MHTQSDGPSLLIFLSVLFITGQGNVTPGHVTVDQPLSEMNKRQELLRMPLPIEQKKTSTRWGKHLPN